MINTTREIILASQSPRRSALLKAMDVEFTVLVKDVDESFPHELAPADIACHIAQKKAKAFPVTGGQLVITADTIVSLDGEILGKPSDVGHAASMLAKLSGRTHQVFTGVCLATAEGIETFYDETSVTFRTVTPQEISYYIEHYKPFDKAGSYGVQDWWGNTVVTTIVGSYTNVMGLPTEKLYKKLCAIL